MIRKNPLAGSAVLVAAIGAATLVGAWVFQYGLGYLPCELCLKERIPYYVAIPLGALIAAAPQKTFSRKLLVLGLAVIALVMLADAALSTYHSGVEWHWWLGPDECTAPLGGLGSPGGLLNQLQNIHIPRCDEAALRIFGISLAGYNALITLGLGLVAIWGIAAHLRKASHRI